MIINKCQDACIYVIPYIIKFRVLRIIRFISYVKIHSHCPIVAFTDPGDYDMNKLTSKLPRNVSTQVTSCLDNCFWKEYFKRFFSLYSHVKIWPPIVFQPYPRGSWLVHTWIITTWECSHTIYSFSGQMILEKKILKD